MKKYISNENISKFKNSYLNQKQLKLSRNALTRSQINDVAMDWDAFSITIFKF